MQISPIQQNKVNFEAKQRFLNAQQYSDLKTTLTRMNSEVEYAEDKGGMHFASRLIGRMTSDNINAEIIDGRFYVGKVADNKQMAIGQTELRLGNIKLKIDNKTAVFELLNQTERIPYEEYMLLLIKLVENVIRRTHIFKMGCNISKEAVYTAYNLMKNPLGL